MKVTYIFHSGFLVETDNTILVFDYYKFEIPEIIKDKSKKVFFFASHTHSDHFNPIIFDYADTNVTYIISHDIKDKISHRDMLDNYKNVNVVYVKPDEKMKYDVNESEYVEIETLKSTDRGVAFIVSLDGKTIYHAGDLNEWVFDSMDKSKRNDMTARYERELDKIKERVIDIAFLPVDYRLGEYKYVGPYKFLNRTRTKKVYPMHMWKRYREIPEFRKYIEEKEISVTIEDVDCNGKTWIVD